MRETPQCRDAVRMPNCRQAAANSLTALFSTCQAGQERPRLAVIQSVPVAKFHQGGGFRPGVAARDILSLDNLSHAGCPAGSWRHGIRPVVQAGMQLLSVFEVHIVSSNDVVFGGKRESIATVSSWKTFNVGQTLGFSRGACFCRGAVSQRSKCHEPVSRRK